jgi:hypothetical protein
MSLLQLEIAVLLLSAFFVGAFVVWSFTATPGTEPSEKPWNHNGGN